LLSLEDVYLDFAGRHPGGDPIHSHLAELQPGSELIAALAPNGNLELLDSAGIALARFSAKGRDVWKERLNQIQGIKVVAMVERYLEDSEEKYAKTCRCERWEVPIIEITSGEIGARRGSPGLDHRAQPHCH
jgi:ATP-dependent DNA helicase RecQ